MENIETLIENAIENAIEVRQCTFNNNKTRYKYEPLQEGETNGSHMQLSLFLNPPMSRASIAYSINPCRDKYGIVKHTIRKSKEHGTYAISLTLTKNARVMKRLENSYVDHAVKIMNHIEMLLLRVDPCIGLTVTFSEIESLHRSCVHPHVIIWLRKAFALTRILHLTQTNIYFLRFSIY